MYPIMLDLHDRPCLLVGAGNIAHQKLVSLLAEKAKVTIVAPAVLDPIQRLVDDGAATLHRRPFAPSDVEGASLVFVATGNPDVDRDVVAAARARGIWVNVADVPALCDFYLPSRIQRGDFQLAISSAGSAPFAVRRLRQRLEDKFGQEWSDWVQSAKRFRGRVNALSLPSPVANQLFDRWVAETVHKDSLAIRLPTETEESAWIANATQPAIPIDPPMGHVALVGAGPGNPGLLTVRGLELLRQADAVVYDRLAIQAIPLDLPDHVQLVDVGKAAGSHPIPQDEINQLLLRLAREGKRVVRLKGGDPFVFARGGEEAMVLRDHGVQHEVVPGVTAGIAGPALAGIPVTFRRQSVRVTLITAHEGGTPQVRWDLLAQDRAATLVGYMGISTLDHSCASLLTAGMPDHTPAAIIENATLPEQRSVRTTLAQLPQAVKAAQITSPALFVIGDVVALADALAPPALPLHGLRIGTFSPRCAVARTLQAAGAHVLAAPNPLTKAARLVLESAPLSGWLVRSIHDLDALAPLCSTAGVLGHTTPLWCPSADVATEARRRSFPNIAVLDGELDPSTLARRPDRTS